MTAHRSVSFTGALRAEYDALFASCKVVPKKKAIVESTTEKLCAGRSRYEAIASASQVPWHVVGIIHLMECGLRFDRHLHNGDSLEAQTTHVPKHRPAGAPPFTFEQSAMDALKLEGFADWGDWSVAGTLYKLEAYNGFGYRLYHPNVNTPYLWSFTTQYSRGKYATDGKFDPALVSQQVGAAAVLRSLADLGIIGLAPSSASKDALGSFSPPTYPGRLIRRGEPDRTLVRQIQRRLAVLQCGPVDDDGVFGSETESAVKLFQTRWVDRNGDSLVADGVIGPLTWDALFGSASFPVLDPSDVADPRLAAALKIAESQAGVREAPPNSNRGPEVEAYQKSVGIPAGSAWCAAFVYWCFEKASKQLGIDNPVVRTGGCLDHWRRAPSQGARAIDGRRAAEDPSLIQPGQIFIIDHGNGKGHTGLVKRVQGSLLDTIEGNTNGAGSREGDGVYLRQRKINDITAGFLDYSTYRLTAPSPGEEQPELAPIDLPDVAPLDMKATCGGLLLQAVEQGIFEPPIWVDVPFQGHLVRVGAHALRAKVGGRLLRLPASYQEVVAISNTLGWVPATSLLSDTIWHAAAVRPRPAPQGKWSTPALSEVSSRKAMTLEYVVLHDEQIEEQIPTSRQGELAATEGKDWILSPRNATKAHAATTYGWHDPTKDGRPIQGLGPDTDPPWHNDAHFDYSQTLRPIQRKARRVSDGAEVDLLDILAKGLPVAALAPFMPPAQAPRAPKGVKGGNEGAKSATAKGQRARRARVASD